MDWRTYLRELVSAGVYRTQGDLVEALSEFGCDVDQGTISRELRAMRVIKVDGAYRLPPPAELPATIHRVSLTSGDCLAVVRTDAAFASAVAQHVAELALDGVLGTIAGDDTVFVALTGPEAADRLLQHLGAARPAR